MSDKVTKEWLEGYKAGRSMIPSKRNPYEKGSKEFKEWLSGHRDSWELAFDEEETELLMV